jgi:hypothetical protein
MGNGHGWFSNLRCHHQRRTYGVSVDRWGHDYVGGMERSRRHHRENPLADRGSRPVDGYGLGKCRKPYTVRTVGLRQYACIGRRNRKDPLDICDRRVRDRRSVNRGWHCVLGIGISKNFARNGQEGIRVFAEVKLFFRNGPTLARMEHFKTLFRAMAQQMFDEGRLRLAVGDNPARFDIGG